MTSDLARNRLAAVELYSGLRLGIFWADLGDRRRTELQLLGVGASGLLESRGRAIAIPNSAIFEVSDAIVKATLLASRERR